jgi:hypothetical protein
MTYTAKETVCSEICTKHSMQSEHYAEFLNVKTWWYVKKPLGFKRLMRIDISEFEKQYLIRSQTESLMFSNKALFPIIYFTSTAFESNSN